MGSPTFLTSPVDRDRELEGDGVAVRNVGLEALDELDRAGRRHEEPGLRVLRRVEHDELLLELAREPPMRTPALKTQLPKGKTWLRVDFEKEAAKLGIDFSGILDESQTLGPLQRGLVSTSRLGRETVAGKSTTHYRAIVDVHRAAAALPAYAKQIRAIEKATGTRLGRTTQDVWVGTDGRIRRIRSSTPTVVAGTAATSVQTMTFRAYDVPVSIAAPPRAQVFDFS